MKVAERVARVLPDDGNVAMLTLTCYYRQDATLPLQVVRDGLPAVMRELRPGMLGQLGAVEWGCLSGAVHAHVLCWAPVAIETTPGGYGGPLVKAAKGPWLKAGGGFIIHAVAAQAHAVRWYLLEYATKISQIPPDIAARAMIDARGMRRYRTNGALYAVPTEDTSDYIDVDTGEILQKKETCPQCDEARRLARALVLPEDADEASEDARQDATERDLDRDCSSRRDDRACLYHRRASL